MAAGGSLFFSLVSLAEWREDSRLSVAAVCMQLAELMFLNFLNFSLSFHFLIWLLANLI